MYTATALALDDLASTLAAMAGDDDLQGDAWLHSIVGAFIACPLQLPLDHTLYEALIGVGGLDLADPSHLEVAAHLTTFLVGTGLLTLSCDHETPTILCALLEVPDPIQLQHGAQAVAEGTFDELIAHRTAQAAWFRLHAMQMPTPITRARKDSSS